MESDKVELNTLVMFRLIENRQPLTAVNVTLKNGANSAPEKFLKALVLSPVT